VYNERVQNHRALFFGGGGIINSYSWILVILTQFHRQSVSINEITCNKIIRWHWYISHLMMGTERFPETLCFLSELTRLTAREDFITSCRRESFKSHISYSTCFVWLYFIFNNIPRYSLKLNHFYYLYTCFLLHILIKINHYVNTIKHWGKKYCKT
jgi:hypothetical protein